LFLKCALGLSNGLAFEVVQLLLAVIPGLSLNLSLGLKLGNRAAVLPANLSREASKVSVRTLRLQPQNPEGRRDNHLLDLVIGRRDSFKDLKATKSTGTLTVSAVLIHGFTYPIKFVGEHSSDGLPEDHGGSTVVERSLLGVGGGPLTQIDQKFVFIVREGKIEGHTLVTDELATDVESFATNSNDLLTFEKLLSYDGGKAAEEVATAINYNFL
jgi:hypothetical protein